MNASFIAPFALAVFLFLNLFPDPEPQIQFSESITVNDLYEHLSILASDSLEGRETGKRGQKMAAEYIKKEFIKNDLLPVVNENDTMSYYQKFNLIRTSWEDVYVKVNNKTYHNFDGIVRYGKKEVPFELSSDILFAGNGTDKEIDALEVAGKAILFLSFEPYTWAKKVDYARTKGAIAFFIVNVATVEEFENQASNLKDYLTEPKVAFSPQPSGDNVIFYTSPKVAGKIFNTRYDKLKDQIKDGEKKNNYTYKIKPSKIAYQARLKYDQVETENVLGFIEGGDKKEEVIVITAHYDHIGMKGDQVYNGADDDASGTSAVIEIAQAFALAKKGGYTPRRSILFMAVTGEEKGLLGSQYYTNNPIFPLEKTVANLNIDMIGRLDEAHAKNPDYVYLIGSNKLSTELHDLSEEVNANYTQLDLDYRYNDDKDPNRFYYRSDHYNFAKNNIPVIFYFNGTHEDYHQLTDTVDKINFEKLEKITRLIFYTAWELANKPERISLKTN
ncbi:MAG: M28 family metallopeptidase [Bacteroidota bacterium]|nr:M28 family metallopeptidase [Bacteroidota bacterium]